MNRKEVEKELKKVCTAKQRQSIGFMRKLLSIDDETYREMLSGYGVQSSKELTVLDAGKLLFKLKSIAQETGVFQPKKKNVFLQYRYNNTAGRDNKMATPAQLRMIEAMWYRVSYCDNDIERGKALEQFAKKICGKEKMLFLTKTDISKLKTVIERMEVIR